MKKTSTDVLNQIMCSYKDLLILGIEMSKKHLYDMIDEGQFPPSSNPFCRKTVWRVQDIKVWLSAKGFI